MKTELKQFRIDFHKDQAIKKKLKKEGKKFSDYIRDLIDKDLNTDIDIKSKRFKHLHNLIN